MLSKKTRRKISKFYSKPLDLLTFALVFGILLLSVGVYLVGINFPGGNFVLMLGSFIIYVSVIILAFKI